MCCNYTVVKLTVCNLLWKLPGLVLLWLYCFPLLATMFCHYQLCGLCFLILYFYWFVDGRASDFSVLSIQGIAFFILNGWRSHWTIGPDCIPRHLSHLQFSSVLDQTRQVWKRPQALQLWLLSCTNPKVGGSITSPLPHDNVSLMALPAVYKCDRKSVINSSAVWICKWVNVNGWIYFTKLSHENLD